MRATAIVFGAVLLTGCASSGVHVDENQVQALQKGHTTNTQVIAQLGQPTANALLPDGRRSIVYAYSQVRARPASFIPIVGPFAGGADARSSSASLVFDPDGILEYISSTQTQVGTSNSLPAGAPASHVSEQPRSDSGK